MNTKSRSISMLISQYRLVWLLLICVFFVAADQMSKKWAQNNLANKIAISDSEFRYEPFREVTVISGAASLIYRENPAAAFSLTRSFPDWFRRPFLLGVSFLASIFFLIWYFRIKEHDGLLLTSFCLIMAGAVGNLIDRATLGYVIDFLDLHGGFLGYPTAHWPTFNIADSCIVVGAIGILLRSFRKKASG